MGREIGFCHFFLSRANGEKSNKHIVKLLYVMVITPKTRGQGIKPVRKLFVIRPNRALTCGCGCRPCSSQPDKAIQKQQKLKGKLDKTIAAMQKVQRNIAADAQPVSMHELGELEKLGKKYRKVVLELAELAEKKALS